MADEPRHFSPAAGSGDMVRDAADWLARRDRGLTADEAAAFARWREADPQHDAEFKTLEEEWHRLDLAKELPELAALARQLEATKHGREVSAAGGRWLGWSVAFAAAAAIVLAVWVGGWRRPAAAPSPVTAGYRVVPHATRTLTLADGSLVELRAGSEVQPDFSPAERRVRLVRGEAHFTVTKNPARPFVVTAGPVSVRAVGTAFDVRLETAEVNVLVTEGHVRVDDASPAHAEPVSLLPAEKTGETPLLGAGQSVRIPLVAAGAPTPASAIARLAPAEIDLALAWQSTWLVFARTPLEVAVEAFNREASGGAKRRLVLGDDALRGRRLGGTFRADNPDGFVRLLEQGFEIRAEARGDGEIVLRAAR